MIQLVGKGCRLTCEEKDGKGKGMERHTGPVEKRGLGIWLSCENTCLARAGHCVLWPVPHQIIHSGTRLSKSSALELIQGQPMLHKTL